MPAGTEIITAMEKPSAIITNNARIFLLEMFLAALVKTPNYIHHSKFAKTGQPRKKKQEFFPLILVSVDHGTAKLPSFITDASSFPVVLTMPRLRLIKPFFRIIPKFIHSQWLQSPPPNVFQSKNVHPEVKVITANDAHTFWYHVQSLRRPILQIGREP